MSEGKLSKWSNPGKSWFFGIGINEYQAFTPLTNAVRDVEECIDLLVSKYDVDPDYVHTLFDDEASKKNIIDTLDFLGTQVGAEDKLIIYYSGHGKVNNSIDVGYWIPFDGEKDSTSQYISNSTIRDYVGGIDAKHILLISDSCFSGTLFMRGDFRSTDISDELSDLTSRWAICSGRHDEEVYDGEPGSHSPFAQSILNILSANEKDYIPIGRIVNHVIEETAANYEQLPDGRPMFGVGHGGGQYIFRKKGSKPLTSNNKKKSKSSKIENNRPRNMVKTTRSRSGNKLLYLAGLWVTLGALLLVSMVIPKKSIPVILDVEVSRIQFSNLEESELPTENRYGYVGINNFESIHIPAMGIEIYDEKIRQNRYIPSNEPLINVLPSPGDEVGINFEDVDLYNVHINPGTTIILDVPDGIDEEVEFLTISCKPGGLHGELVLQDSLAMQCNYCILENLNGVDNHNIFNFLEGTILGPKNQVLPIEFRGGNNMISLEIESMDSNGFRFKEENIIRIADAQFTAPDIKGRVQSSLLGGTVQFVNNKNKPYEEITIKENEFLTLSDYEQINLNTIQIKDGKILLSMSGTIGTVKYGPSVENLKRQNPTLWQWLSKGATGYLMILFGIAIMVSFFLFFLGRRRPIK